VTSEQDVPPDEPGGENQNPEGPGLDIDAEFAAIVAAWEKAEGTTPAEPVGRWPVSEDLSTDDAGDETDDGRDRTGPSVAAPDRDTPPTVWRQGPDPVIEPLQLPSLTGGPTEAADGRGGTDAEETFTPPEPLPIPKGDLMLRFAWVSVLAGPLFLLACLFLMAKPLPTWTIVLGVGGFVGGFAVLVARMPSDRGEDDDDGAVV
jgi:hypothetical protein